MIVFIKLLCIISSDFFLFQNAVALIALEAATRQEVDQLVHSCS